ncbi:MAG: hypothetical protein WDZ49_01370 [Litorilinea sp.]
MDDAASMVEFAGIGELAETTTHLLALSLHAAGQLGESSGDPRGGRDPVQQMVLQQARDHLDKVREGFILSVRTNQVQHRAEIGYLLDRVLIDWDAFSRELGLDSGTGESADAPATGGGADGGAESPDSHALENPTLENPALEKVRFQLLAFAMAAVALGFLPKLGPKQITFPHSFGDPPTYSDIPVPVTAGEMLARIEEMQGTVWQMMSNNMGHLIQRRYGPVRRTYGFFEASAWLTKKEAARFGMPRNRTAFSWF